MKPRPITDEDVALFEGTKHTFHAPINMPKCNDLDVVVAKDSDGFNVIRIPWELDSGDMAKLAAGEPIWMAVWGNGMPPVDLRVGVEFEGES